MCKPIHQVVILVVCSFLLREIPAITTTESLESVFRCAKTCEDPVNFQFTQGYTYQFLYSAAIVSSFQDSATRGQHVQLHLQASAQIDVLGPCENVFRITNTFIRGDDSYLVSNSAWQESFSRYPLHFSWQDGRIPEICASNNDPTWVLNIKRGILSTLQVSSMETMKSVKEMDVTGNCESSYNVAWSNGAFEIVKLKDYNACEGRNENLLFSHFTPYQRDSSRQNYILSKQTCTQIVDEGIIQRSRCDEEHTFRPFSNEESGARTTISQTMILIGRQQTVQSITLDNYDVLRKTLMFEKEESSLAVSNDTTELQQIFSDICITMSREDYRQVGEKFIRMVFLLRRLDAAALEHVYNELEGACFKWNTALKKMFQDALEWCGSEGCVLFAIRLITNSPESLKYGLAGRWISGMSFIEHPTLPMIREMTIVVQSGILPQRSYLATGTMINRYCSDSATNCLTEMLILNALMTFEDKLGVNCKTANVVQKQDILLSLRALGNAGRSTSFNILASCAQETSNDMETRIAAAQAYRRMPCNADRSVLNSIVFDQEEDPEIRITSYMAVMKCPTPKFIQQIKILLDTEPVKQVASFVWSHLHQIFESTDPLKNYLKPLLLETQFAKQHDLDPRQYSRFYEASVFSDTLNSGVTVESSVVWSPKSFVPRSGDLDLTVEVFGQAVNLLQVGGRIEGVETMIQSMLQSEGGILKNNPISNLFMKMNDENDIENISAKETNRETRSAGRTRSDGLQRQYKAGLNPKDKPSASWYLRLFQNEIFYGNTQSLRTTTGETEPVDVRSILVRMAQGGEYHYHDDTMLINSAHVLPTGVGLPLTIAFNGTASMDLRANGNLDITGLFSSSPNLAMRATFNPRAVILVTGWMSIDAHVTRTGIATESSAITSWTLGGRASINNGRRVEVKMDAPYQRNTLFSFNHKLMKIDGDLLINIGEQQQRNRQSCSSEYAGQRVCLETPLNSAIFPVDGPIALSVHSQKTDIGFDHYLLTGTVHTHDWEEEHDNYGIFPSQMQASITMDTPGSIVNRENIFNFMYNIPLKQFNIVLHQPENQMQLQGSIESHLTSRQVTLAYIRNRNTYRYEGRVTRQYDGTEAQWLAFSSLQLPSKMVTGSVLVISNPAGKVSLNMSIINLLDSPILFNVSMEGKLEGKGNSYHYSGNSQIKIPGSADTGLHFDMNVKPRINIFTLEWYYELVGGKKQHLLFLHKRRNLSTATDTDWHAEQSFTLSRYPRFNHKMKLAHTNRAGSTSSYVSFKYGRHALYKASRRFILLNQTFECATDSSSTQIEGHINFKFPLLNMNHQASLLHKHSSTIINTYLKVDDYIAKLHARDSSAATDLVNKIVRLEIPLKQGNLRLNTSIEETTKGVFAIRGGFRKEGPKGLGVIGRCHIEYCNNRKSLDVELTDDNYNNLLQAHLYSEILRNHAGYNFESRVISSYNNLISLNFRYEDSHEAGLGSNFTFVHLPDKYFQIIVDFENESERAKRLLHVDFKDRSGIIRSIKTEGNMERTISSTNDLRYSGNVSFTNDFPSTSVRNLIVNGHLSESFNSFNMGGSVIFNDVEIVGGQGNYEWSIQEDYSDLTTVFINLRQGKCTIMPGSVSFTGNIHNTWNEGHVLSGAYSHDEESKVTWRFTVNQDMTELQAEVTQEFSKDISHEMSIAIIRLETGLNVQVTIEDGFSALRLERGENSIIATWTNSNHQLVEFGLPRKFDATLHWGARGDDVIGAWLTWMFIDYSEPLKMSIEYSRANGASVSAMIEPVVQTNRDILPLIKVHVAFIERRDEVQITYTLQRYEHILEDFLLSWNSNRIIYNYKQPFRFLTTLVRPRLTIHDVNWIVSRDSNHRSAYFSLSLGDFNTTISLGTRRNSAFFNYFSNFSCISGQLKVNIAKAKGYFEGLNSYHEQVSYSLELTQSIVSRIVNFPRNVNVAVTILPFIVRVGYNEYSLTAKNRLRTEEDKIVIDYSIETNLSLYLPKSYRSRDEIEFFPGGFTFTKTYKTSYHPERMFNLSMLYADNKSTGTKELSALLSFETENISQDFKIVASLLQHEYDINFQTYSAEGWAEVGEQSYRVCFNGSLRNLYPEIDQVMSSSIDFEHNIALLSSFKIPLSISVVTGIYYNSSEEDESDGTLISFAITRTALDQQTSEKIDIMRRVSVYLQLRNQEVIASVIQNFTLELLPKTVTCKMSVSSSRDSSHLFYKSIAMVLTINGNKQHVAINITTNLSQNSFLMIFTHDASELLRYGLPDNVEIGFRSQNNYKANLSIVYDTSKKRIEFIFDYDENRNKLLFYFNHNLDFVEECCKIPKTLGFETSASMHRYGAEGDIRYLWGSVIKTAHVTWYLSSSYKSFSYHHRHNITTTDVFPKSATFRSKLSDNHRLKTLLRVDRKFAHLKWMPHNNNNGPHGTLRFDQNIYQDEFPRATTIESSLQTGNESPYVLNLNIVCDSELKFHSNVNIGLNVEDSSGILRTSLDQNFIKAEQFPSNLNFYSNVSLEDGFETYINLSQDDVILFLVSLRSKADTERLSGFGFIKFNTNVFSLEGNCSQTCFDIHLTQPYINAPTTMAMHFQANVDSENRKEQILHMQWGEEQDKLIFTNSYKFAENRYEWSVQGLQPSGIVGFSNISGSFNIDFSQYQTFKLGIAAGVNEIIGVGLNVAYITVSPQMYRITADMQLGHSFNSKYFGKPALRNHTVNINLVTKNKRYQIKLEYTNDFMRYPIEINTVCRLHKRNTLLESNLHVSYIPEEDSDDFTMGLIIISDKNGLDYVLTASLQYPEKNINGEIVIGGISSNTNCGVDVLAKGYSQDAVQTWEMRVSINKTNRIVVVFLNSSETEAITLTGDLSQVIAQSDQLLQHLISASPTRIDLFRLFEITEEGYNMSFGFIDNDKNAFYSLHLVTGLKPKEAYVSLQAKRNFQLDTEVARVAVVLADTKLIQIRISAVSKAVNFLQNVMSAGDVKVAAKINRLADNVIEFLESFKAIVTGHEDIHMISAAYLDGIIAKVNNIRDLCVRIVSKAAAKNSAFLNSVGLTVENSVRKDFTYLLDQVDKLLNIATQPFTNLHDQYLDVFLSKVKAVLLKKLKPITVLLRNVNARKLFMELVNEVTDKTVEYVVKDGEAALIFVRDPLSELLVVTQTDVIINVPLQFELDHFVRSFTLNNIKQWLAQNSLTVKIDNIVNMVYSYIDEYYKGRALLYIPRDEILPPFKGHTFVSGFRHFGTFDKSHYNFLSGCATSHILIADMRDNNFTVAISYADSLVDDSLNAIEVFIENRYVTVFSDYKVQVNGKIQQLPQDLDVISVKLEGTVVHIRDVKGDIDIACNFKKDLCTVDISPYYFGATAGLAGVYNNEPMDDFTTPCHENREDVEEFAASWEVSEASCLAGNTFRPCASNSISATCSLLFKNLKSPLRSCYSLVDPTPFMQICQDDICDTEDDSKSCAAASAYAFRCRLLGAQLLMPDHCVTCTDALGETFDASENRNQDVSSLDFVFVLEQSSCMRSFVRAMRKFMNRFDRRLTNANHLRNNHFHIVGYGGSGNMRKPNTVTIRSELFTSRMRDVKKMIGRMRLPISEHIESDSLAAISYATQLPFRAGAKPIIFHLACSTCSINSDASYSNVEWQLHKRGITFHHVQLHTINAGRKVKAVYGFDQTTAFAKFADMSSLIVKPSKNDTCVPLAISRGGSVWDAKLMEKFHFAVKFSRYIISQVGPRIPQSCSCQLNEAGIASALCT